MNNVILRIGIFVVLVSSAYAQHYRESWSDALKIKRSSELFDERGFLGGKSIDVDGKLNINNSNGSLSYVYPISDFYLGGHKFNLSLNYASNVSVTAFQHAEQGTYWRKFSQNRPMWILGINGFALQTISTLNSYLSPIKNSWYNMPDTSVTTFNDANFVWLVDGYDYSNRMEDFVKIREGGNTVYWEDSESNPHTSTTSVDDGRLYYVDKIRILKEDGSILELFRQRSTDSLNGIDIDTLSDLYSGVYAPNEPNPKGYAIVKLDKTTWGEETYARIQNGLGDEYVDVLPRIIHYFPGDGLEYIFRECPLSYGQQPYTMPQPPGPSGFQAASNFPNNQYPLVSFGGRIAHPKIVYLEEIKYGAVTIFNVTRSRHQARHELTFGEADLSIGRALVTEIPYHKFSWGNTALTVDALGRTYRFVYGNKVLKSGTSTSSENTFPLESNGAPGYNLLSPDVYSWNNRKSWAGYITQIIDPEERVTTIDYDKFYRKYTNICFPNRWDYYWNGSTGSFTPKRNTLLLANYRITAISDPKQKYSFQYQTGDTSFVYGSTTNACDFTGNTDTIGFNRALITSVSSVTKKTLTNENLSLTEYLFNLNESSERNTIQKCKSIYTDYKTNRTKTTEFKFQKHYFKNAYWERWEDNYSLQDNCYTNLVWQKTTEGTVETTTTTSIDRVPGTYSQNDKAFYWQPSAKEVKVRNQMDNNSWLTVSKESYFYPEVVQLYDFNGRTQYGNLYGISRDSTIQLNPTNPGDILFSTINKYKYLSQIDTTITLTERYYNKIKTLQEFFRLRDSVKDSSVIKSTWEDVSCKIAVWDSAITTEAYQIAPVYGLNTEHYVRDKNGVVISGVLNTYEDLIKRNGELTYIRGQITADTVLGYNGIKLHKTKYKYRREWDAVKPYEFTNIFNAKSYSYVSGAYYDFAGTVYGNDMCDRGIDVFGRDKDNLNAVTEHELSNSFFALAQLESQAEGVKVRRYKPTESNVSEFGLIKFYERGRYGLKTGETDYNNWYSKYDYDKIGRLTKMTLPYDFHNKDLYQATSSTIPNHSQMYSVYTRMRYNYRMDEVHCSNIPGNITYTENGNVQSNYDYCASSFTIGTDPTPRYKCPCDPRTSSIKPDKKGNSLQETCFMTYSYRTDLSNKAEIFITLPSNNEITQVDSVLLNLRPTFVRDSCTEVVFEIWKVASPSVQLEDPISYVFNCSQGDSTVGEGSDLVIDLTPYLQTILSNNRQCKIVAYTTTPSTKVTFAGVGDDVPAKVRIVGTYHYTAIQDWFNDYTAKIQHDDYGLFTKAKVKVDDYLHTSNIYPLDFNTDPIRRSELKNNFRGDGALLNTITAIGDPFNPIRRDTIKHTYTGWGEKTSTTDQLNFVVSTQYDASGRPTVVTNQDNTRDTIRYLVSTPLGAGITDNLQDWFGMCSVTSTVNEKGVINTVYKDVFGRTRREVADSGGLNITTRYEYDVFNRLTYVINPNGDTTRYWYDAWGRIKYKYQPDMGVISYAYDKIGNVRFTQTQDQANRFALTYYQYDDIGRMTISGEAMLMPDPENPPPLIPPQLIDLNNNNLNLQRFTDVLEPSVLHDNNVSAILTANKTLWLTSLKPQPQFVSPESITTDNCQDVVTMSNSGLFNPPYTAPLAQLKHPAYLYPNQPVQPAPTTQFENISLFPEFVRVSSFYDEMPQSYGTVWGNFPALTTWNRLAPHGTVRNLKGNQCAIAYRNRAEEPYNYTVFSYDERGRVEAVLRYTDNLGFDAIYYTYNSMNSVISIRTADALNQHTTWYGYNHNGQVDSVWTLLSTAGLGVTAPTYPMPPTRPQLADMSYSYTKRGQVDTLYYPTASSHIKYGYNARMFLNSVSAKRGTNLLFAQTLNFDNAGQITSTLSIQRNGPTTFQRYTYDNINRLVQWLYRGDTTAYLYDNVGNRTQRTERTKSTGYTYGIGRVAPNQLKQTTSSIPGNTSTFMYNADGATIQRSTHLRDNTTYDQHRLEDFGYDYNGLTIQYRLREDNVVIGGANACTADATNAPTTEWRYRYNAMGEREQKRLTASPQGDTSVYNTIMFDNGLRMHPWTYYQLGADSRQHAVYNGVQSVDVCMNSTRNVWLYPVEYLSYGVGDVADIVTRPDGNKEYHLHDQLGSVRAVLNGNGVMLNQTDYAPFGNELWQGGNATERRSWIGKEQDNESELGDFGVRKYDNDLGRFLKIDEWWEKYRLRTPYSYCDNSPTKSLDPSGLGDEDSKDKVVEVTVSTVNVQAGTSSQGVQIKQTTPIVSTNNKKVTNSEVASLPKQSAQVQLNAKQYVAGVRASSDGSGSIYGGVGARSDLGFIATALSVQSKLFLEIGVDSEGALSGGLFFEASASYKPPTTPGVEIKAKVNLVNATAQAMKAVWDVTWSYINPCFIIPGIPN